MIANRLQIALYKTKVRATANVDVRGTLKVDKNVPVHWVYFRIEPQFKDKTDESTSR
ncbi:hypothetical protein LAQ65_18340 [Flavihumibacter profundi]|nr:hypothetical protein [Flavihumibacter profundi]MBZ5859094.1 hypothetical protein [Flavihumibacter profundi]